jgi:hypothetical protein
VKSRYISETERRGASHQGDELEGVGGNRVEEMGGHGRGRGLAYLVNDIVLTGSSLARGRTTALSQTLGNIRAPDPAPVASAETPRGGRGQRPDVITSELPLLVIVYIG